MKLEQAWRWYGPDDPVSLLDIKQAGASAVVTALHHIPPGQVWPQEEIMDRGKVVRESGLNWSIVESVAVHEDIKTRTGSYQLYLDNYKQTLENLGICGITTVCYNFMPVLDWTRTHLNFQMKSGSLALRFDRNALIAFDCFVLKRPDAHMDFNEDQLAQAEQYFKQLGPKARIDLQRSILMGLPGTVEDFSLDDFSTSLQAYRGISEATFREHFYAFLKEVIPTAEKAGVKMAVHPDDPPMPIFGLPRIVSNEKDLEQLLEVVDSPYNGITFCTGSLGAGADNDVTAMIKKFSNKIHFVHLRNIIKEPNGSFYESDHLTGDVDMFNIIRALLEEQQQRIDEGRLDSRITMRPDHGHQMLDDLRKQTYPGYSAIGRLRGLGELRGLELGIEKSFFS